MSAPQYFRRFRRLLLTNGAYFCVRAGKNLKEMFVKLRHVTCVSHMLAGILYSVAQLGVPVNVPVKLVNQPKFDRFEWMISPLYYKFVLIILGDVQS